ncbi:type I-C CRISPR-associated protein Cas7/Csd2 [Methylococcaceae bacterium WWC4]|nr:type I-C CRISPR-associated protein Cas7/Csd2 [Methylomonas sp. LWB]NJA05006.1 type I-C CRISPR-associated protein Cas7/Csd2 [Methylococcaceae bacterium WWC4]OHX37109.1 type I-C CRISPR-associated protein Cas7/Csd2 [Methylomonas sp. LWB]
MTIQNRYEFVYLFDVSNGNPNGDPDAGNMPRLDPESSKGLVTDVCLKRKIRNFIELTDEKTPGYKIYVKEKSILNLQHEEAYKALGIEHVSKKLPKDTTKADEITLWMCKHFFDIRAFGAVMTTEVNCGQVRGPVQLAFAKSIDPIIPLEISITRMAVTTEKEAEEQAGGNRTMGRKHIVPYGLYRAHGFISAKLAKKTGFSETDLEKLWQALALMFEHDRSAARGEMAARKLVVFKHSDALGNVPAHALFERVKVERINGENDTPASSFSDYKISIDKTDLKDVTVEERF